MCVCLCAFFKGRGDWGCGLVLFFLGGVEVGG